MLAAPGAEASGAADGRCYLMVAAAASAFDSSVPVIGADFALEAASD